MSGTPLRLLLVSTLGCHKWPSDSSAAAYLKTITSAEAAFHANDRDGNKLSDFWVKDVAGLHGFDAGAGPINRVVPEVAQADQSVARGRYASVPGKKTYIGHWFAALKLYREIGKNLAYDDGTGRNPSRFGLVAFPVDYGDASKMTFIVNEKNIIFSKDTRGKPPEEYPEDPMKEGWKVFQ